MTDIDLSAFKPAEPAVFPPISFDKDPQLGYIPVEDILGKLNRRPFATWDVHGILSCPQPLVYKGARQIMATRAAPYFQELFGAMREYDVHVEEERIDFFIEMLNQEMPEQMTRMLEKPGEKNPMVDVILAYCDGVRGWKRLLTQHKAEQHDFALGLALSIKMGFDILGMMGFTVKKRATPTEVPLEWRPSLKRA